MSVPDRTDHVLATIDGALNRNPADGDAMRWTTEPSCAQPPAPPLPVVTPAQLAVVAENLAPLATAMGQFARQIGEAYANTARQLLTSPAWRQLADFALSPEGRALLDAHRRGELEPDPGPCNCLCTYRHPGMHICEGEAAGALRYETRRLGVIDVTMCQPCLEAERTPT